MAEPFWDTGTKRQNLSWAGWGFAAAFSIMGDDTLLNCLGHLNCIRMYMAILGNLQFWELQKGGCCGDAAAGAHPGVGRGRGRDWGTERGGDRLLTGGTAGTGLRSFGSTPGNGNLAFVVVLIRIFENNYTSLWVLTSKVENFLLVLRHGLFTGCVLAEGRKGRIKNELYFSI